ncbi:MAG: hypothetical protein KAZ30_03780, partial [Candidatus Magasanikbacteria bacterium]|nr:hypothetical protein [Candidatus Magasanikbacteria bacterium]
EFFGYSTDYRVGRTYFASQNQAFRGLTFFNTYGQAPGVAPVYHISAYNPERKVILALYYGFFDRKPEVIELNKTVNTLMENWEDTPAGAVERADIMAHEAFKKLVETKPRSELSFGPLLQKLDAVLASVH